MQNLVILAGNVGATPEARTTQGGTRITHFSLATSRPKRDSSKILRDDNNRRLEDTEWHRITCFNGVGKTVEQYVDKGMKVMVRGRIHYTRWTDNENIERYGVEIIADEVTFLTRAKANENAGGGHEPRMMKSLLKSAHQARRPRRRAYFLLGRERRQADQRDRHRPWA
jgi:single-strand DNA-binding protein